MTTRGEPFEPRVLYEDNHLLGVLKPPGVLSQGDSSGDESMFDVVRAFIKRRDAKPGNVYLGLLHRLDRQATGLLLLAKTSKAAARMSELIRERAIEKTYWALVEGDLSAAPRRLRHFLESDPAGTTRVFDRAGAGRKEAVCEQRVLHRQGGISLVEVQLETGRKHQIRAQLAHLGCPILGDARYGARGRFEGEGIALLSRQMHFVHPVTRAPLTISVPDDLCPLQMYLRRREPGWRI